MERIEVAKIIDDRREISWIDFNDSDGTHMTAGKFGCGKIVAYAEHGSLGPVPYLAVYKDGQVEQKIPAHMVIVHYTLIANSGSQKIDTPEVIEKADPLGR